MEFACGFVYVPPAQNAFKQSALPPTQKCVRPRVPPPPPPTSTKQVTSASKVIEQLPTNEVKKEMGTSVFYENDTLRSTVLPASTQSTQNSAKKTALLPPHMRITPSVPAKPRSTSYSEPWRPNSQYEVPPCGPDLDNLPWDPDYIYHIPETSDISDSVYETQPPGRRNMTPTVPPRPVNMQPIPEYLMILPSKPSTTESALQSVQNTAKSFDNGLPGNPNVVLVSLGKLLFEERVQLIHGEPVSCSKCGSVLDSIYANVVEVCYFCKDKQTTVPVSVPEQAQDILFSLSPDPDPPQPPDPVLLFCIDTSGSMIITSQVIEQGKIVHRSRLKFVQNAVFDCVQRLSEQKPKTRVGLVTFNYKVTLHGYENYPTHYLSSDELIDTEYLKNAAASFPNPPPVYKNKDYLQRQVMGLKESGTTALGPAALLTIEMASRHPGSKVIICTDGKANTELGNLEEEDIDARTLLSSTIFYQELGEYAASQGVTVSVLSIEGTDCRLDELGRLADRTGGKVVIASPKRLHQEFEEIIENNTIATHCAVSFLLPKSLHVKGEREASHKGVREVGNIDPEKEITFQFGLNDHGAHVPPPASGNTVYVQLQVRYTQKNGQKRLRVITVPRVVTNDSSLVLSSLSLPIIQLNSSQVTAALAVRGRFVDATKEGEQQKRLIERAIALNASIEDKDMYQKWIKIMEAINNTFHKFTRKKFIVSDSQSLTDADAALLYTLKHSNRKSIHIH
ncbi:circularly permutated Ras protein 1 [Periophthalmus magnuspinnatus]|uniref:circularly permutated Ras protein 1 n=1 Tax=Periophthalmus magnuspinnatus TaxID=409849 RepID=UPI00145AD8C4|nr:circularly permutated Ras protein 1 [Periophthalmus magnuspinnatus]